ncbi:hypothetical protein GYMLUDRAFT_244701 [Collybiopsis luxurians FD-317 M1]|uniref:Uncharacterized protein n=1 Tax=Collybiopsis luxurians FD-317 M1 TaxID=944289 RepID=A0A0D0B8P4_9AGAR|nr:hypothetical protein GYMLUDRAFT_244701 [Collybiopsis luxurians FD-317 M1]
MARLFTVGSGLIRKWERLVSRSYESLDDIKKCSPGQDQNWSNPRHDFLQRSVILHQLDQISDYDKSQVLRSSLLGPLFIAAFKYIMPSTASALEPKLQPTRSGNAKIRVYVATVSYSKKDGSFKAAEWSSGLRKPQPSGGEIFGAEDNEDNELASDSDLMLLHQHMGDYIDSAEEVDRNPNHPPASKTSNASSESPKLYTKPCPQTSTFLNPAINLHNPPTSSYLNARHSSTLPNPQSTCQQAHCVLVVITSTLAPTVKPYTYTTQNPKNDVRKMMRKIYRKKYDFFDIFFGPNFTRQRKGN